MGTGFIDRYDWMCKLVKRIDTYNQGSDEENAVHVVKCGWRAINIENQWMSTKAVVEKCFFFQKLKSKSQVSVPKSAGISNSNDDCFLVNQLKI